MKPIEPDLRPLKEFILAKINYHISKTPHLEIIQVDLYEFGDEVDLFVEICKAYEASGWSCYIYRYMTLFARNKIVLSKTPKPASVWFIDTDRAINRLIKSKPLAYMMGPYEFTSREAAQKTLDEYDKHFAKPEKTTPRKNWFKKLFS